MRRIMAMALMASALTLLAAAPASAVRIGSNLQASPNGGICPTVSGVTEVSCTYLPFKLTESHAAPGGLRLFDPLVVTSWRVSSGLPSPGTVSVKLRLRAMRLGKGPAAGLGSPFVDLPLAEPGVHVFKSQLPLNGSQEIGLDAFVVGLGDDASAPIAHRESGVGEVAFWRPSLGEENVARPFALERDTELLLSATVEPDRDRDGFGDETQDECPEDPARQDRCDRKPPRIKILFARHQDFLGTRRVVVKVRSNEAARAYASSQLDLPGVTWGLDATQRRVRKGGTTKLVMHVPPRPRRAGERARENGKRIYVRAFVSATDASGNRTRLKAIRVKP
jgi:hypothetical protein